MMYCTNCGLPCEAKPMNVGPQTEEDHRLRRDSFTEEYYSTCCEAQTSRFQPEYAERLVVRIEHGNGVSVSHAWEQTQRGVKLTFKNGEALRQFADMVNDKVSQL